MGVNRCCGVLGCDDEEAWGLGYFWPPIVRDQEFYLLLRGCLCFITRY